ncbi:MAG: hypothetical protein ABIO70_21695 [Pseudomonadota bacterium]
MDTTGSPSALAVSAVNVSITTLLLLGLVCRHPAALWGTRIASILSLSQSVWVLHTVASMEIQAPTPEGTATLIVAAAIGFVALVTGLLCCERSVVAEFVKRQVHGTVAAPPSRDHPPAAPVHVLTSIW